MPATVPYTRPSLTKNAEYGIRDGTSSRRTFAPGGTKATRKVRCKWDEVDKTLLFYLGANQIIYTDDAAKTGPTSLNRLTPQPDPFNANLFAMSVENITGFAVKKQAPVTNSDTSKSPTYELAEIELNYEALPYKVVDDATSAGNELTRYVSIGDPKASVEYLGLPGGTIKYWRASGSSIPHGQAVAFNVGKVLPIIEIVVTWHKVPYDIYDPTTTTTNKQWQNRIYGDPATPATVPYLGCVNKTTFLNYPAGSLLLANVQPIRRFNNYGQSEWDIEFTFAFDRNKWNHKYFSSTTLAECGYQYVGRTSYYADGSIPDGESIYNERDFADLFKVT